MEITPIDISLCDLSHIGKCNRVLSPKEFDNHVGLITILSSLLFFIVVCYKSSWLQWKLPGSSHSKDWEHVQAVFLFLFPSPGEVRHMCFVFYRSIVNLIEYCALECNPYLLVPCELSFCFVILSIQKEDISKNYLQSHKKELFSRGFSNQ